MRAIHPLKRDQFNKTGQFNGIKKIEKGFPLSQLQCFQKLAQNHPKRSKKVICHSNKYFYSRFGFTPLSKNNQIQSALNVPFRKDRMSRGTFEMALIIRRCGLQLQNILILFSDYKFVCCMVYFLVSLMGKMQSTRGGNQGE